MPASRAFWPNARLTNWLIDAPCRAVLVEPEHAPDPEAAPAGAEAGGMPAGMKMPEGMKMPPAMAEAMKKMGQGNAPATPAVEKPAAAPVEIQVDRTVLANGAVLVSQTNPDSPVVAIHLAVRGRAAIDGENAGAGALDLVHRLLEAGPLPSAAAYLE